MKRLLIISIVVFTVLFISCGTETEIPEETDLVSQYVHVFGQGFEGSTLNDAEATIHRTRDNGIFADLSMPTPEPGSYNYPEDAEQGSPEVFTLWIFVFNDPESDQFDAAYLGSAHVADDLENKIRLNGHITSETEPFTGEGFLTNYMGAKVRLTVAPHGRLNPDKLPGQLTTPSGGPDYWWISELENPENEQ